MPALQNGFAGLSAGFAMTRRMVIHDIPQQQEGMLVFVIAEQPKIRRLVEIAELFLMTSTSRIHWA